MSSIRFRSLLTGVAALSLWAVTLPSYAVTLTFTDSAAFFAGLPGSASTLDFDHLPLGTLLPSGTTLHGIAFSYAIIDGFGGQLDMAVVDDFDTTSGTQSLGLDDPGNFNQFLAGDDFDLGFATPIRALGLFFMTSDALVAGDLQLLTSVGTALNSATAQFLLADGGLAYFLGLTSTDSFIKAQIRFAPEAVETFLFAVDDLTTSAAVVPEPGTAVLLGIGLIVLLALTINVGGPSRPSTSATCTFTVQPDGVGALEATVVPSGPVSFPPLLSLQTAEQRCNSATAIMEGATTDTTSQGVAIPTAVVWLLPANRKGEQGERTALS